MHRWKFETDVSSSEAVCNSATQLYIIVLKGQQPWPHFSLISLINSKYVHSKTFAESRFEPRTALPMTAQRCTIIYAAIIFTEKPQFSELKLTFSVTRLGDFLHFGQQFKAGGKNYFTQIAHIVREFL